MAVNLVKGQKVNLKKENGDSLNIVIAGLGWDQVPQPAFGGRRQDVDCDASAILCVDGKCVNIKDVIYFGNKQHASGTVLHSGDNLTGAGAGYDEMIGVALAKVPEKYDKIVFVVNIYQAKERRQHFGMIRNAFIAIYDSEAKKELFRYNLTDNYSGMTAMVFAEFYRYKGEWKLNPIGQGTTDASLAEIVKRFT